MTSPRVFLSYAWEASTRAWTRALASRLRVDGVNAVLDQWEVMPGDMLPAFMEKQVRESDFILIICTPKYKDRSEARKGGVGYEGHVMTGEVFTGVAHRKFIPILCQGEWNAAAPSWLSGAYYIDLSSAPLDEAAYEDLLATLHGQREAAPPIVAKRLSRLQRPPASSQEQWAQSPDSAVPADLSQGESTVLQILRGYGGSTNRDTILHGPDGSPGYANTIQSLLVKGLARQIPSLESDPLFWRYEITERGSKSVDARVKRSE